MEQIKKYYPYLDGLKGIAIILMVMAHVIAWSLPDIHFLQIRFHEMIPEEFNASFLWKLIYSFHMPLLFTVSGFLFYHSTTYNWGTCLKMLRKRIVRILLPYVVTGGLMIFFRGYFGYWFLQILFIVNVIVVLEYMLIHYLKVGRLCELILHLTTYCSLYATCRFISHYPMPTELNNITGLDGYYMAFMLGVLLRQYPNLEKWFCRAWVSFVCLILYVTLFALQNSSVQVPLVGTFIPLLAIAFLYALCKVCDFQTSVWGGDCCLHREKFVRSLYIACIFRNAISRGWCIYYATK